MMGHHQATCIKFPSSCSGQETMTSLLQLVLCCSEVCLDSNREMASFKPDPFQLRRRHLQASQDLTSRIKRSPYHDRSTPVEYQVIIPPIPCVRETSPTNDLFLTSKSRVPIPPSVLRGMKSEIKDMLRLGVWGGSVC